MEIFKQLSKKGYKHYYGGTIEELDSMDENNPNLHSEIMQVVIWLYKKYDIWIEVRFLEAFKTFYFELINIKSLQGMTSKGEKYFNSPTEAYGAAIDYTLNKLIL